MSDRVRRMTAREVEAVLGRNGFDLISQKGSHRKWRHPDSGLRGGVFVYQSASSQTMPLRPGTIRVAPAL